MTTVSTTRRAARRRLAARRGAVPAALAATAIGARRSTRRSARSGRSSSAWRSRCRSCWRSPRCIATASGGCSSPICRSLRRSRSRLWRGRLRLRPPRRVSARPRSLPVAPGRCSAAGGSFRRRVHHRRQGSRRLHQRRDPDRAARRARHPRSGRRGASRPSRATCSSRHLTRRQAAHRLLRRPLHGVLHPGPRRPARSSASFPHLFPASIAIGYGIDGLTGARRTTRRVGGPRRAGGVFRGRAAARHDRPRPPRPSCSRSTSIQVWFARYPNAEVVMQALLFARCSRTRARTWTAIASSRRSPAALLGLLLFLRFDAVLGDRRGLGAAWRSACSPDSAARAVLADVLASRRRWPRVLPARADARVLRSCRSSSSRQPAVRGSTPCSRHRRRRRAGCRPSARPVPAACDASSGMDAADRRPRSSSAGALRALLPPPGGTGSPLTTPTRCGRSPTSTSRCRRCSRRCSASRSSRGRGSGATRRSSSPSRLRVLLLLQDPHRPRALLGGAPVPAGDPARRRCCSSPRPRFGDRGGGLARAAIRGRSLGVVVRRAARRRSTCGPARRCSRTRRIRRADPQARAARRHASSRTTWSSSRAATPAATCTCSRLPLAYIYAQQRARARIAAARQGDVRGVPRVGAHPVPAGAVHRRRRHRPAVASLRRRADRERALPGARVRVAPSTPTRGSCGRRSSSTASTSSSPPGRGRRTAGSISTSACNDDLHVLRFHAKEQTDGRTFRWTRPTSYVSVTDDAADRHAKSTLGMSDGGRPAAAPPARRRGLPAQPAARHDRVEPAASGRTRSPIPPDLAARAAARAATGRAAAASRPPGTRHRCSARPTTASSASWSIA